MSLDIRAGMAQGGADPCHKLRGAERLCNIIVSTTVQSRYLILLLGPGGNDDNWSGGPAADAVQHIQPVIQEVPDPKGSRWDTGRWTG